MAAVTIDELTIADEPARWAALGFVVDGEHCRLGDVRLRFVSDKEGARGLIGWSLRGVHSFELDGLLTTDSRTSAPSDAPPLHPNGVLALDHVVAFTPDFQRSLDALQIAGLDLRRVREQPTPAGAPRQAFFRLGREILEVVQMPEEVVLREGGADGPARFWGLALLVADLDRCVESLGDYAGEPRAAVQPGRRIATVRRSAGLAVPLALMSAAEPVGANA